MFRGIYHITLDTKGRLSVPAKVRAQFEAESADGLILTAELEGQLLLYTLPEWEKVEKKLVKLPSFDPQIRRLKRLYMGNAAECELDSTGPRPDSATAAAARRSRQEGGVERHGQQVRTVGARGVGRDQCARCR